MKPIYIALGVAVVVIGILIALSVSGKDTETSEIETIRIGTNPGTFHSDFPVYVGMEEGIFERYGLSVELTEINASISVAALQGGSLDYSPFSSYGAAAALQGADVRLIASLSRRPALHLVGQPGMTIENIRHIGVTNKYDTTHRLAVLAMHMHSITPEIVEAGGNSVALRALLSQGRVDAIVVGMPGPFEFAEQGYEILDRFEDMPIFIGLSTHTRTLEERPDQVQRVLAAFDEARRFAVERPEETKAHIRAFFSIPQGEEHDAKVDALYAFVYDIYTSPMHPTPEDATLFVKASKAGTFESWQDIVSQTATEEDVARVFDFRFLPDHE